MPANHTFETETTIPASRDKVFAFFSHAHNLEAITPPFLKFRILTPCPILMKEGTQIDYYLHLHGIPIRWRTRITEWAPTQSFTDQQIKGPYRYWVHRHLFQDGTEPNTTIMQDRIDYRTWGGIWINKRVHAAIEEIFEFRQSAISRIFATPAYPSQS